MITFQVSNHYLTKLALRIETLISSIHASNTISSQNSHHLALLHCLELMKLIEKPELKSRFLKEFIRLEHCFNKYKEPDFAKWQAMITDIIYKLNNITKRVGEKLLLDPCLQSMRQSQSITSHDIDLEHPLITYWLNQSSEHRQHYIEQWLNDLSLLSQTTHLYLSILRVHAEFKSVQMSQGFYHEYLTDKHPCNLVILKISERFHLVPKIQIGHHGISIRFFNANNMLEDTKANDCFELAICHFI